MLPETLLRMLLDAHDSLSFLSSDLSAVAGVALDNAGETEVEGGEAGCSCSPDPNPASRLNAFAAGPFLKRVLKVPPSLLPYHDTSTFDQ